MTPGMVPIITFLLRFRIPPGPRVEKLPVRVQNRREKGKKTPRDRSRGAGRGEIQTVGAQGPQPRASTAAGSWSGSPTASSTVLPAWRITAPSSRTTAAGA